MILQYLYFGLTLVIIGGVITYLFRQESHGTHTHRFPTRLRRSIREWGNLSRPLYDIMPGPENTTSHGTHRAPDEDQPGDETREPCGWCGETDGTTESGMCQGCWAIHLAKP